MAPKVSYNLDLRQIFDRAYKSERRDLRDALRELLSDPAVKREYGLRVVEQIRQNTQSGIDKKGKDFPKYSKAYIESTVFEIYNKSASDVNLTLTGEMLSSMDVNINKPMMISVYFPDKENNDKAHGNITGQNGKRKAKRDFLGLPPEQEDQLLQDTITEASSNRLDFLMAEDLAARIAE